MSDSNYPMPIPGETYDDFTNRLRLDHSLDLISWADYTLSHSIHPWVTAATAARHGTHAPTDLMAEDA